MVKTGSNMSACGDICAELAKTRDFGLSLRMPEAEMELASLPGAVICPCMDMPIEPRTDKRTRKLGGTGTLYHMFYGQRVPLRKTSCGD